MNRGHVYPSRGMPGSHMVRYPPRYSRDYSKPPRTVDVQYLGGSLPPTPPSSGIRPGVCLCIIAIALIILAGIAVLAYFLYPRQEAIVCEPGYQTGNGQAQCFDIDECQAGTHSCSYRCVNLEGSYRCECQEGYRVDVTQRTCSDEDECSLGRNTCQQHCVNTEGSYTCQCRQGYQLQADQRSCTNINECETNNGGCSKICYDKIGSFDCNCPAGYTLEANNEDCTDEDECNLPYPRPINGGCEHNCENTYGSFKCFCNDGWNLSSDGFSCVDINECTAANSACEPPANCVNSYGSFDCVCPIGYTESPSNGNCLDIDECMEDTDGCSDICNNNEGSYSCGCLPGYELQLSPLTCMDIDECALATDNCEDQCINTVGSFTCGCTGGLALAADGVSCIACSTGGLLDCSNADSPTHCWDILQMDAATPSGVCEVCLTLDVVGVTVVPVYCDMDTTADAVKGGWTVFQKRQDGSVGFFRNWDSYAEGFGEVDGEYWLGLENIHALTSADSMELHITMVDAETPTPATNTAYYASFAVDDAASKYLMTVGTCKTCTAGDAMARHNNLKFTTLDEDNDLDGTYNCALFYKGAWWHDNCLDTNPNGLYLKPGFHADDEAEGIEWRFYGTTADSYHYSQKYFDMKVRPV